MLKHVILIIYIMHVSRAKARAKLTLNQFRSVLYGLHSTLENMIIYYIKFIIYKKIIEFAKIGIYR